MRSCDALARATGRRFAYKQIPLEVLRQQNPEVAVMFEWFDCVGYSADVDGLRREFPEVGWQRFEDWAQTVDWRILDQVLAAE